MMKASAGLALAATFAAFASQAEAKMTYIVEEDLQDHEHKTFSPVVGNSEKCAYDTSSFRLCATYGASAKIGWEFEQEFYNLNEADSYYKLKLDLYSKQGVDLEGLMFADRLISFDSSVTLDDFKMLVTFQTVHYYSSGLTCFGGILSIDDLQFDVILRIRLIELSKNFIEHLWTLDNWDSYYAKWIDEFGLSDYTPI